MQFVSVWFLTVLRKYAISKHNTGKPGVVVREFGKEKKKKKKVD